MPTIVARPVCGKIDFISPAAPSTLSSTFEMARATALASPARMRSSSVVVVVALKIECLRLSACYTPLRICLAMMRR
jgi:hypothetical protein